MLKMRMSDTDLMEDEPVAAELHAQEQLDDELRNLFLAYAEAPIPPALLDLVRHVEGTLRREIDETGKGAPVSPLQGDYRRFYH